MKDFLELLVDKFGLPSLFSTYFMLIFYIIVGFFAFFKGLKYLKDRIRMRFIRKILNEDLHPYFTHAEILKYTKFYVPQYFQNVTPTEGEELGRIHGAAARSKLMPEFVDKGLLTKSPVKYFIILADTGMGKTAFLINLFRKYKTKSAKLVDVKYQIYFFPLGDKYVLDRIRHIENKNNSILLLDAFDEDIKAVQDYKLRMIEILEAVRDFRKIIFTCRTQFFPSKDEEPLDTNDITFGENIHHKIQKIYLSAFDDNDIKKYLFKKYDLNFYKIYRAFQLVKKCPSLMFRPMLLTYIDDLVRGKLFYQYSYEMYQVLIQKWVEREASKPAILSRNYGKSYPERLIAFSKGLSQNLYEQRDIRQGYFISVEELKKVLTKSSIDPIMLSIEDKTGRSLLNRNSLGQFKFAHKSILEYFLAVKIYEDPIFLKTFDFHGMDATQNFHSEMLTCLLKSLAGKFFLANEPKPKSLTYLTPSIVKKVSHIILTGSTNQIGKNLAGLNNLKRFVFTDPSFLVLYVLYIHICYQKDLNNFNSSAIDFVSLNRSLDDFQGIIQEINDMIPNLSYEYINKVIEFCEIEKSFKNRLTSFLNLPNKRTKAAHSELLEIRTLAVKGRSEKAVLLEALSPIREFYKINTYIPSVELVF